MSMSLFVSGIVAGIALVYSIIIYFKFTTEPLGREMNDLPKREMNSSEETYPVAISFDDVLARYDAAIEIFAVKEI